MNEIYACGFQLSRDNTFFVNLPPTKGLLCQYRRQHPDSVIRLQPCDNPKYFRPFGKSGKLLKKEYSLQNIFVSNALDECRRMYHQYIETYIARHESVIERLKKKELIPDI